MVLVSAVATLPRGQDVSFDLLWYHYYYPWLMFHGGIEQVDPEPFPHRYFNPLPLFPWYFLQATLSPLQTTFVIAVIGALNLVVVRRIAARVMPLRVGEWGRLALSMTAVLLAATGCVFRTELGMSLVDVIVSIPMLIALLLVLHACRWEGRRRTLLLAAAAGCLSGVAIGAKLTMGPYVIALGVAVVYLAWSARSWLIVPAHVAGWIVGVVVSAGWWFWPLWQKFGNPVFPYYNAIFKSPLFPDTNLRDTRYGPTSLVDAALYPWYMWQGTRRLLDVPLRDPRWVVLCVAVLLAAIVLVLQRRRVLVRAEHVVLALFFTVGSVLWLVQFGIARYAVTGELLTGVVLVACLWLLLRRKVVAGVTAGVVLAAAMLPFTELGPWLHHAFRPTWFGVDERPLRAVPPGSMVLASVPASSYLLTYLPPGVKRHVVWEPFYGTPLLAQVEQELARAKHIYVLVGTQTMDQRRVLDEPLHLRTDVNRCQWIRTYAPDRLLCPATYVGDGRGARGAGGEPASG